MRSCTGQEFSSSFYELPLYYSTNNGGHSLDLVLASKTDNCFESVSVRDNGISDHSMVLSRMKNSRVSVLKTCFRVHCWKSAVS